MKAKSLAPVVLRIGLAIVILWFGLSEVTHPGMWTSYIPTWLVSLTGIKVATLVVLNGTFEIIAASMIAIGIWTRWIALLLFLHMLGIVSDVGLNAIGMRDVAIAFGLLAVTLQGSDIATLQTNDNAPFKSSQI